MAACSKRRVTSEEDLLKDDLKKSRVEESDAEKTDGKPVEEAETQAPESEEVKVEAEETAADSAVKEFALGETRPTPVAGEQKPCLPPRKTGLHLLFFFIYLFYMKYVSALSFGLGLSFQMRKINHLERHSCILKETFRVNILMHLWKHYLT